MLNKEPDISSKNIYLQFENLFGQFLEGKGTAPNTDIESPKLIIVIDALDECEVTDLKLIMPRLVKIGLKLFITSRPNSPTLALLRGLEITPIVRLQTLDAGPDIRTYLKSRMTAIKEEYDRNSGHDGSDGWPSDGLIERLTQLASPLFIAAATICRMIDINEEGLNSLMSPEDVIGSLLKSQRSGLKGVEIIYTQILEKLDPGSIFRAVMGPIVVMFDSLHAEGLSQLLGVERKGILACLTRFTEIIDISRPEAPIKPFHLSLRDFLTGTSAPEHFRIHERETHRALAKHCAHLLNTKLYQNICKVKSPGRLRSEVPEEKIRNSLPPELQYACRYWVDHLEASGDLLQDNDETHILLQNTFPMWIEALAWMDHLSESPRMIHQMLMFLHVRNALLVSTCSITTLSLQILNCHVKSEGKRCRAISFPPGM